MRKERDRSNRCCYVTRFIHVAVTYDRATGKKVLYADGNIEAELDYHGKMISSV